MSRVQTTPSQCSTSSAGFARAIEFRGEVRKGGGAPLRGSGMGEYVVMIYGKEAA